MPRALISVYDKTGLDILAHGLAELGWDLVASGGTARALEVLGLSPTPVETVTQAPEMLAGRVKTLHPAIHAAILARDTAEDLETLKRFGFAPIDMVVCNLYPFQETISQEGISLEEAIEQIDVGGVAMVRAAAKNFARVAVVCDPADYGTVLTSLRVAGRLDDELRRRLAVKAFALTRDYDTAIHAYLARELAPQEEPTEALPAIVSLGLTRILELRYGENPHQHAGLYAVRADATPLGGQVLGGKELSYNNLLDLDAAWRAVGVFETGGGNRQASESDRDRDGIDGCRSGASGAGFGPGVGLWRRDRHQPLGGRTVRKRAGVAVCRGDRRAGLHPGGAANARRRSQELPAVAHPRTLRGSR